MSFIRWACLLLVGAFVVSACGRSGSSDGPRDADKVRRGMSMKEAGDLVGYDFQLVWDSRLRQSYGSQSSSTNYSPVLITSSDGTVVRQSEMQQAKSDMSGQANFSWEGNTKSGEHLTIEFANGKVSSVQ